MIKNTFYKRSKKPLKRKKLRRTISDEKDNKLAKYVGEGDIAKIKMVGMILKLGSEVSRAHAYPAGPKLPKKWLKKQKQEITHRFDVGFGR